MDVKIYPDGPDGTTETVPREQIARVVHDRYQWLEGSRNRDFVPLVVELPAADLRSRILVPDAGRDMAARD